MRSIDADALWRKMEDSPWNDNADRDLAEEMVLSMPTLTPPNEWVSVEERLPENEARQYIEDDLDGIGYLYPCLLTYKAQIQNESMWSDFTTTLSKSGL